MSRTRRDRHRYLLTPSSRSKAIEGQCSPSNKHSAQTSRDLQIFLARNRNLLRFAGSLMIPKVICEQLPREIRALRLSGYFQAEKKFSEMAIFPLTAGADTLTGGAADDTV